MKNKKLVVFVLIIATIRLWFLYLSFHYPIIGINLTKVDDEWIVASGDPKSITSEQSVLMGDSVISIDGKDPGQYDSVIRWRSIDQAHEIVFSRDGSPYVIDVRSAAKYTSYDLSLFAIEIVSFIIAILLYVKLRYSRSAMYLSMVFVNIGATFMSLPASIRGDTMGKYLVGVFVALLPVAFLKFLFVLLDEKGSIKLPTGILKYMLGVSIALAFFQVPFFFRDIANYAHRYTVISILLIFIVGIIINMIILFHVYWKYRHRHEYARTIVKFVGISLLISFTPLLISLVPQVWHLSITSDSFYSSLFILFFPISFTYLIATKKLYDIDIVVRRMLFVAAISILPSAAVTALIGIIVSETHLNDLLLIFVLLLLTMAFMLYSFEYFTTKLEKVMFPRKHALNVALKNISSKLGSISSFHELKEIVLVDIVQTLDVYGAAIVLRTGDNVEVISAGVIDEEELGRVKLGAIRKHMSYTCLDIQRNEEYESCLVLTQKRSHTMIGLEETQWLNLIVTYLSVSLENVHLIRKLMGRLEHLAGRLPNEQEAGDIAWFRKLMFRLQEKERVRMANDLHDTTLQDLFFLKRKLVALAGDSRVPQLMGEQLHSIADYVEIINMNLRQSCFELNPHLLTELGLVRTIEKLVETEQVGSGFEIQFLTIGDRRSIEGLELESQRHLFRIVQEMLNNAKKHSEAKRVTFQMAGTGAGVQLVYEDDGVGFEADREQEAEMGASGTGLDQIKGRVMSMDGQFELVTGVGQGMSITIRIPGREERSA